MRRLGIVAMNSIIVVFLVLIGCAPKAAPVTSPIQVVAVDKAQAKEAWEEEWERTIAAARKEGKIIIYGSVSGTARQVIWGAFTDKYKLPVESVAGRSPEIIRKVVSERNAGLYTVDVLIMGPTEIVTMLRPLGVLESLNNKLLLPEVKNPEQWLDGKLPFMDPEHTIFTIEARPSGHIGINTNLAKPGEIKSARNLLNPKWKGKIILNDFRSGTGSTWMSVMGAYGLGWDYLRELAKQEPVIVENERLMIEWLAHGKYAILVPTGTDIFNDVKATGAPIDRVDLEDFGYVTGGSGTIVLLKDAPHPNTARLFINWLSSKEGQLIWQKGFGTQSARVDISTDFIDPLFVRNPEKKYFDTNIIEFRLSKTKYIEITLEIFKEAAKSR